ncbi:helix-turn-helix domain-containing protein [Gordonia desulfuricans]|uniref:Helix-turn-helix domain-containing protein n=1 Tax=Gordonia desulfuricans TaxID=89051 RepID=A0A7K3LV41_9ACTN|nr:helix-turn-helix domain-containing protein [Gordonia desulfuricans]NDK91437.1 helix-turn-helix domain-containing protein [Gordonia desulfuricans]
MPQTAPQPTQRLTTLQAAKRLGVRTVTVQRYVRDGKLPAEKLPGRTGAYLIDEAAVDVLAAERREAHARARA